MARSLSPGIGECGQKMPRESLASAALHLLDLGRVDVDLLRTGRTRRENRCGREQPPVSLEHFTSPKSAAAGANAAAEDGAR
jgi:hypothetical protein